MRWIAALVAVCGCNQVFGLDTTQLFDAPSRTDGPPDAPPVCPAVGAQLRVNGPLVQSVRQNCGQYTMSVPSRMAVAYCYVTDGSTWSWVTSVGRVDDAMGALKMQTMATFLDMPRLSPEGDELYMRTFDGNTGYLVEVFDRQPDGSWVDKGPLAIAPSGFGYMTQPTRGPRRHILLTYGSSIREFADDGTGAWPQVGETTYAELGMTQFNNPSITGDGLRLTFGGYPVGGSAFRIYIADRADITAPFSNPRMIADLPDGIYDAYIPEDCSRVYFAALSSIFYAQLAY